MSETFMTMHHVLMDIADYFRECKSNSVIGSAAEKRFGVYVSAITDADRMLKEQEPKVLTLDEVRYEYEAVWLETKYLLPPTVCLVDGESNVDWLYFAFGSDNSYGVAGRLYGKNWRCWSAKPTDEQREAVPWER